MAAYGPMSPQFSNWEVPPVVLLCRVLQRLCAVCTGFGVGLTAAEPLGSRYRHPLRIRSCMTSSSVGSAAKNIYIYIYIYLRELVELTSSWPPARVEGRVRAAALDTGSGGSAASAGK